MGNGVESLTDVVDVAGVDSSNRNTAIWWHVYRVFFDHFFDHFRREASIGKHTDLLGNVGPVVHAAEGLQSQNDLFAELSQSLRHVENFGFPQGCQFLVAQNSVDDSGSVDWRIRILRETGLLEPGLDDVPLLGIGANQGKAAGSLTVEPKVFGEGLCEHDSEVILGKKFEGIGIFINIVTGETLVGAVKEDEVSFLHAEIEDSLPLVFGWVDSRWVLSAGLNQKDLLVFHLFQIFAHTFNIDTFGVFFVVSEVVEIETCSCDDVVVEGPGWIWHVDSLVWLRVEALEHGEAHPESSSTRYCLHRSDSVFLIGDVVWTIGEIYGLLSERGNTVGESVLFIEFLVQKDSLSSSYRFENIWLACVISVGTDSKKNFLWRFVFEEEMDEAEDWIWCASLESTPH